MAVEMLQFRFSPYNEKVRWALDFKRVPHRRTSLLPGPHMGRMRRLTGQSATPTLGFDGNWIAGSARLLDEIERRWPEPALFPADPALRARAKAIEARFDDDWGPRTRRFLLDALMRHPGYLADLFGQAKPWAVRRMYQATLPLAGGLIRKGNGITGPESVTDGERALDEALDFVAAESAATGYLAGDTFSAADLTAAAMLVTIVDPPDSPMTRPRPVPPEFERQMGRVAGHPAIAWAHAMYRNHRGARTDHEGEVVYD